MPWPKSSSRVLKNELLCRHTSFKIGGPAEFFIIAGNIDELRLWLNLAKIYKRPVRVIGAGSNILAADLGLKGITLSLDSPYFKSIAIKDNFVEAGASVPLSQLIRALSKRSLGGAEFLAGIPGTIGGALAMNAGVSIKVSSRELIVKSIGDLVESARVIDYNGMIVNLKKKDIKFAYRTSSLTKYIILSAVLKLKKSKIGEIDKRLKEYLKVRKDYQDYAYPSAGCVFKNPLAHSAGKLIDLCGLKGKRIGKACVSSKHANFIINLGKARAKDVLKLIDLIKTKVKSKFGIDLEPEIKIWK